MEHILSHPPSAEQGAPRRAPPTPVTVQALYTQPYQVVLRSFGTLVARTQTTLVPQVSGVVVEVAGSFLGGGYFSKGDLLLRLDDSDYQIALRNAQAPLLKARALLAEEQARGVQAAAEWKSLKRKGKPSALVLRTPQIEAAKAEVLAAKANVERAKLDLRRTSLYAPYDGRVASTSVGIGQYVAVGTPLALVFATDVLEVRIPLSRDQQRYIRLPERPRGEPLTPDDFAPTNFIVEQAGRRWHYLGRIVRTESAIDANSRQLFVIGEIVDPFSAPDLSSELGLEHTDDDNAIHVASNPTLATNENSQRRPLLKLGQFIEAEISAAHFEQIFVIPRHLLLPDDQVLLAENGKIVRRTVAVIWRDQRDAVIDRGIREGELLITTRLGNAVSGAAIDYSE